jgi:glyceraldehyde 3-phosphate dehydrogenase
VVIEAVETHTRTGFVDVRLPAEARGMALDAATTPGGATGSGVVGATVGRADLATVRIPVTHVKVFGWYDNEMGSYSHRLGELTAYVAASM